jgi:hypothetical protein
LVRSEWSLLAGQKNVLSTASKIETCPPQVLRIPLRRLHFNGIKIIRLSYTGQSSFQTVPEVKTKTSAAQGATINRRYQPNELQQEELCFLLSVLFAANRIVIPFGS